MMLTTFCGVIGVMGTYDGRNTKFACYTAADSCCFHSAFRNLKDIILHMYFSNFTVQFDSYHFITTFTLQFWNCNVTDTFYDSFGEFFHWRQIFVPLQPSTTVLLYQCKSVILLISIIMCELWCFVNLHNDNWLAWANGTMVYNSVIYFSHQQIDSQWCYAFIHCLQWLSCYLLSYIINVGS